MHWLTAPSLGRLTPENLWSAWTLEPLLLVPMSLAVLAYALGTWNTWRRAGVGHGITPRQCASFLGAILSLVVALVSPLNALSSELFSAHMAQHLILIVIAAPLLALSNVPLTLLLALPRGSAQRLANHLNQSEPLTRTRHVMGHPATAWLLFAIAMWVWHASILYEAALLDETVHVLEHLTFLGTGVLFWWVLFRPTAAKHVQYGMAIPYLFTTALHSGILGALMIFATRVWYSYYATFTLTWGLSPLEDQQLAGLIMWVPGGFVFALLTIGYFAAFLGALEQRSVRLERGEDL